MIRVLCYGDSNTHGTAPMSGPDDIRRLGPTERWPGVAQAILGAGYTLIEEGLPARTTVHDDPIEGTHKNGRRYLLPCLESHWPLDAVIVMLGVNDLKARFNLNANDIAYGVGALLTIIKTTSNLSGKPPKIIVVAAPPILETGWLATMFAGGTEKSRHLASAMQFQAERHGASFLDAGTVAKVSPIDGIHFDSHNHRAIGAAIAEKIRQLIS